MRDARHLSFFYDGYIFIKSFDLYGISRFIVRAYLAKSSSFEPYWFFWTIFGIFFSHYILTLYLFKFGFMYPWPQYGLTYFPVSCILIIGFCWLLIWTMSKIPILKIGSGVK